ncbi:MAG: hypothetical protein M1828_002460 [Chrysothrix sp. TS-e1954]|nr:MAG: hypothetical protein M1828_002460 [Chrysothrix sp. TS-e1954]
MQALSSARLLVQELEDEDAAMFRSVEQVTAAYVLRFIIIRIEELALAVDMDPMVLAILSPLNAIAGVSWRTWKDFAEVTPNSYAQGNAAGLLEMSRAATHETYLDNVVSPCLARLTDYFSSHQSACLADSRTCPLPWAYGEEGHTWIEVLSKRPILLHKFMLSMSSDWVGRPDHGCYPFGDRLKGAATLSSGGSGSVEPILIVDIGGAHGVTLRAICDANPTLNGCMILQDLPDTLASIEDGSLDSTTGVQIQLMSHNFWEPQPIKGARIYYLQRVLHDWSHEKCVIILSHVADAMRGHEKASRVVVTETMLPDKVVTGQSLNYWSDVVMLMVGGKERGETEFKELFNDAGLEIVDLWRNEGGMSVSIEGKRRT